MRRLLPFAILLLLSSVIWPEELTLPARKARADAASGGDKAKFALQYAEHAADVASRQYANGQYDEARVLLRDVGIYSEMAASAAFSSGKRVKQTEIGLRKLVNRLADLKHSVEIEEQPIVQQSIQAVDDARNRLIEKLFGAQNPKPAGEHR